MKSVPHTTLSRSITALKYARSRLTGSYVSNGDQPTCMRAAQHAAITRIRNEKLAFYYLLICETVEVRVIKERAIKTVRTSLI